MSCLSKRFAILLNLVSSLGDGPWLEHSESELLGHVGSVLQLKGVVVGAGVVASCLLVHALGDLEGCESVDSHEDSELDAVAGPAEDILVEQEVGAEEYHGGLQVHNRGVLGSDFDARVSSFHL